MRASKKPPRPWDIDDLLDIGKQSNARHLKAVPVLILEKWVREGRQEGIANFVRTKDLARRLERSKLVTGFKPKATSNVGAALIKIQSGRNLTRPPLIEYQGGGVYRVNLPHYESLLQKYRQIYLERYSADYRRLFPEGEPEWEGPSQPPEDKIYSLLAPLERVLRDQEQTIRRLTEENRKLQAELTALQVERMIADEELRNDCAEFLERESTYIDAIRRAGVVLEERLRKTIGGDGPEKFKHGVDLVDYALRKNSGRLVISEFPAEQEGVHMLFRGAVQFVRNPPSHKKLRYTELEARQAVGLIDYLLSLLRQTKPREK